MLKGGSEDFSCFFDVRKAFDTIWIDGLLFKLFTELGALLYRGSCYELTDYHYDNYHFKALASARCHTQ